MQTLRISAFLFVVVIIGISCRSSISCDFLVASDLHYNGTIERSIILDSAITKMNQASLIPFLNQSKKSLNPFGVFITGDITESGRKEEWAQFENSFGINADKKLMMPVFETFGNHDGSVGGVVREAIKLRNLARNTNRKTSQNNLHYSFNKGGIHFAVLGSYPGNIWDPECDWCKYFNNSFHVAEMSLEFLKKDLEQNLDYENQPVILLFHYGWDNFSLLWWTEKEQEDFYEVIKNANITGIFHGHNHSVGHYIWKDIDIWSAGSPQTENGVGVFLGVKITNDSITVSSFNQDQWEPVSSKAIR